MATTIFAWMRSGLRPGTVSVLVIFASAPDHGSRNKSPALRSEARQIVYWLTCALSKPFGLLGLDAR